MTCHLVLCHRRLVHEIVDQMNSVLGFHFDNCVLQEVGCCDRKLRYHSCDPYDYYLLLVLVVRLDKCVCTSVAMGGYVNH